MILKATISLVLILNAAEDTYIHQHIALQPSASNAASSPAYGGGETSASKD